MAATGENGPPRDYAIDPEDDGAFDYADALSADRAALLRLVLAIACGGSAGGVMVGLLAGFLLWGV